jgi:predicted outer membrane repeat protein
MQVVVDTFTVLYPKSQHAYPLYNYTFDILHGMIPQVSADLFVSPSGDDGNSGLTADDPLKTINYALSVVAEDSVNIYTVNLLAGTYSASTNGEVFPVYLVNHVNLQGVSTDEVILDAEGMSTVITADYITFTKIGGLTITGGNGGWSGGGMHCNHSNPVIEHVKFTENTGTNGGGLHIRNSSFPEVKHVTMMNNSADEGGAIYVDDYSIPMFQDVHVEMNTAEVGGGLYSGMHSEPLLDEVTFTDNSASEAGGGIYSTAFSKVMLKEVRIVGNSSQSEGGGAWCHANSEILFDTAHRSTIYLNSAQMGNELFSYSDMMVVVDTFTVLFPKTFHAHPLYHFEFDILYGLIPQVSADLYVSPEGDNANSGLSPDDPLKSIHFATSIIAEDSLNIYNIHLANGIYSPSTNEEFFPIYIPEYVGLLGEDMDGTILDAEETGRVVAFMFSNEVTISNMTVKGGSYEEGFGGGMFFSHSSPTISNVKVIECYARYGGGIFMEESSPVFSNISVMDNSSYYGGGGICCYSNSHPVIDSSNIWSNTATTYGGGMYCSANSSPTLTRLSFKYNNASTGAGMYCSNNSNPALDQVTIVNNVAEHSGGGIYAPYSNLSINRSVISDNQSTGKGGGVYLSNFTSSVENTIISGNTAQDGAGLYISASAPRIVNCEITQNVASQFGGGIYMSVTEPELINLTIGDNTAEAGSGIFSYRSETTVVNTILWNEPYNEVFFKLTGTPSSITFAYSDVQGADNGIVTNGNGTYEWLEGNINSDPAFEGGTLNPYVLTVGSPCIEAGTPDTTGLLLPYCDLLGCMRVWDGDNDGVAIIDMGAYEYDAIVGTEQHLANGSGFTVESYPNPFTDEVVFSFVTPGARRLSIEVMDISGNRVMTLEDGTSIGGKSKISHNLGSLNKGIYFVRIVVGNEAVTRKMVKIN